MLKRPLPGFSRRLSGFVLTSVLITSGSYVLWAAQPEQVSAREQQQEDPQIAISADRVNWNGDIDYSGNVIIRSNSTDRAPQVFIEPDYITPDGSMVSGRRSAIFSQVAC
jgi:hypothetical protein